MVTLDTNVAVYALSTHEKMAVARQALAAADFISVQVLNDYASVARRKLRDSWDSIGQNIGRLCEAVQDVRGIDQQANHEAIRLADRYQLAFFDALVIAVALSGGARTIYSEDMHDGLVIDDTLRIVNPFRHGLGEQG